MMIDFDFVLKGFAIISTIIATLRAGSRAIYISEHQAIGLVDGPTIISPPLSSLPPPPPPSPLSVVAAPIRKSTVVNSNSTAIVEIPTTTIPDTDTAAAATTKSNSNQNNFNPALYELAENFKHCVRVSSTLSSTSSYKVEEDIYENIRYDRIQQDVMNSSGKEDLPSNNKHSPRRRRRSSSSILQQLLPYKLSEILYLQKQQKRRNASRQRKDPFNNDHQSSYYTLGYTSYEPKTFKYNNNNNNKQYNDDDDADNDDDDDALSSDNEDDTTGTEDEDEALAASGTEEGEEAEEDETETEKSQFGSNNNNTNTTTMSFTSKIPSFLFHPFNSIKKKVDNYSRSRISSSSFLHTNIGQKGSKFLNYWTSTSSTASDELWNYLSSTSSTAFEEEDDIDDYVDDDYDERSWDYGRATEADYFYNVGVTTTLSSTIDEIDTNNRQRRQIRKRKRLAELTSYCPNTFYDLRTSIFGISEEKYIESIIKNQLVSFQSNSKGAARSGGIFFFTQDGAYMIKTIPNREKNTLLQILPKYHEHMKRYGRSSLLTRFCGMYGIKIQQEEEDHIIVDADGSSSKSRNDVNINIGNDDDTGISTTTTTSLFAPIEKEYTFIVMNAVFPPEANKFISERFDLKGSTVGREVSEEELKSKGSQAVLKDLDLCRDREVVDLVKKRSNQNQNQMQQQLRIQYSSSSNSGGGGRNIFSRWNQNKQAMKEDYSDSAAAAVGGFTIGATAKAALLSQLRKDVKLLIDCQVMDYSLLVGIVHRDNDDEHDHGNNNNNNNAELLKTLKEQNKILERLEGPSATGTAAANTNNKKIRRIRRPKLLHPRNILYTITTPIRLLLSPPIWFGRKIWDVTRVITVDTIVTYPMPYYGSGICGVDGGQFSVMHGKRKGHRAIYYMGLIDFLQPWSTRKVFERKLKGLAGYDTTAISAVTPEEYATRFLDFLDQNIN